MHKRFLLKAGWYVLSIVVFWNMLIAFRAWRFTHFAPLPAPSETRVQQAGFFSQIANRFTGRTYYKTSNTETPRQAYQTVKLTTRKGLNIECWYVPAPGAKGTIILFHGLQGSKQNMLPEAGAFYEMGYNTLLADFRAHGGSDGYRCTLGASETEEVKLAMNFVTAKGEKNIILYGASMGAATIMHAISRYPEIQPAKVVLDMPFASYEKLVEKWFQKSKYPAQPGAKLFTFWAGLLNGRSFFRMKPSSFAKDIQCPVLLQWGRNDNLVPGSDTRKIFDNIPSPQKQMVVYEECGHESYCVKEKEKWTAALSAFLK
ncbi:MAG: alpha/beta hydrolase [Dinghuibacter sp.]|nr:alpha/beta hydrolase [Dinghuibacter sp.]